MTRLEEMQNAAEMEGAPTCFDQEQIIENCTVQILSNTVTGETSVGWWRGTAADMPESNRVMN